MPSFKIIGSLAIAIACAQMVAIDVADARRGGGAGMRAGGFGGSGMRAGGVGGAGRVGLGGGPGRAHISNPIARPGIGNRPGGPGWAAGPGNRPGWGNRPGYGYGYRPGFAYGAAALGTGLAYGAYNSGAYYGDYSDYDPYAAETSYSASPDDAIAECAARFKTYDPASQTYIVRKGQRASCP